MGRLYRYLQKLHATPGPLGLTQWEWTVVGFGLAGGLPAGFSAAVWLMW